MGTSTSCSGGKTGSPFDPEWLASEMPDGNSAAGGGAITDNGLGDADGEDDSGGAAEAPAQPLPNGEPPGDLAFAPSRRFADARTKMSGYLAGGGRDSLRSAVKSMVNKGMGGPRRAASTMRRTAQGAEALGQFLVSARDRSDPRVVDWVERVRQANLPADDLILELVKEIMPDTGSVDEESLRNAATEALGQLYVLDPTVDLLTLTDQQIHEVMAITIANDVCNRMDLQLGQTYERLKYDPQQIQMYLRDMTEYVRSEVRVVMERLVGTGLNLQRLAHAVLQSALEVFAS